MEVKSSKSEVNSKIEENWVSLSKLGARENQIQYNEYMQQLCLCWTFDDIFDFIIGKLNQE